MRRALLLLATAAPLAMTGCHTHDDGTATFFWRFQDSQGAFAGDGTTTNTGCSQAGVDTVRITVDGSSTEQPCVASNGVPGVQAVFLTGTYDFTIDGLRGGEPVFSTSGTFTVHFNRDTEVDATLVALSPQSLVIFTDNGDGTVPTNCVFKGINGGLFTATSLTYSLVDAVTLRVVDAATVPCDTVSIGFATVPLPLGDYEFTFLAAIDAQGSIAQLCNQPVSHTGFPVFEDLLPAASTSVCQ